MQRISTSLLCGSALLLGTAACSDESPTTLAQGEDIEIVGSDGIGSQTLNITAEDEDGEVRGEVRFNEVVVTVQCADTDTDGVVILGGEVTTPDSDDPAMLGEQMALIIREGDPDGVALVGDDSDLASCADLLESISEDSLTDENTFTDVELGSDIETS